MSRSRNKTNRISIIAVCIVVFGIGYYILEFISTRERPPLGTTFHVILGCLLMCVSLIVLALELKAVFFPKKRKKKGSRPVFLDSDKTRKED